jgi:hypothetical protein
MFWAQAAVKIGAKVIFSCWNLPADVAGVLQVLLYKRCTEADTVALL